MKGLETFAENLLAGVNRGAGLRTEVPDSRRDALVFLILDESRTGQGAELRRLVAGGAGAGRGDREAMRVEEDLQGLHISAGHAELEVAREARGRGRSTRACAACSHESFSYACNRCVIGSEGSEQIQNGRYLIVGET